VVFLAGNHDHHIVVWFLPAAVELKIASGASAEALSELFCTQHRNFFQRFLDRRLDGIESGSRTMRRSSCRSPSCCSRSPSPDFDPTLTDVRAAWEASVAVTH
jgi:hypothetical protein